MKTWGERQRYFREVVLAYDGNECLIWPWSRDSHGYGRMRSDGKLQYVSRLVCQHVKGPPPTPAHQAAHSCGRGNDSCVTKGHLSWKTRIENETDKLTHGTRNRGERCGTSKLTEDDVRDIMALKGRIIQREIAALFGVGQQQISKIHRMTRWGWLDPL